MNMFLANCDAHNSVIPCSRREYTACHSPAALKSVQQEQFSIFFCRVLKLQEICQFANIYVRGSLYQRAEDEYLATNASVV